MLTTPTGSDAVNNAMQDSVLDRRPRPVDAYVPTDPEELRLIEEMRRRILEQRMEQRRNTPRY